MIYLEQTNETLVTLSLAGDEKAYEALVLRYQKAVLAASYSVTRNLYLSEDAAQDAFVSAWMKLDCLRESEKFGAWVCRIAKNRAKNIAVRYQDYISYDLIAYAESDESAVNEYADESHFTPDGNDKLHDSVNSLSDKIKTVIMLHYFEGYSIAEIAEKLFIPVGTVKWRLNEGRQRIGKDMGITEERDNMTLAEKVMKKVEQLKLWKLKNSKKGFEEAYADALADIEQLPESADKYHALADVLMRGYWWLPGDKNDALMSRLREAAEKGGNEDVLGFLITAENNKISGKDKVAFIRDNQIPRLESCGYTKTLGREWFWLGYANFEISDMENGCAAMEKAMEILPPSDEYHTAAAAAIRMHKKSEDCDNLRMMAACAAGQKIKFIDGKACLWSNQRIYRGQMATVVISHDSAYTTMIPSGCDHVLYDTNMKVGDKYIGSDGFSTLTFAADNATAETACGRFEGCELWIKTSTDGARIVKTYYKRNIGIVRIDTSYSSTSTLKSYKINGGTGLIPFAAGNRWEYTSGLNEDSFEYENVLEVTYSDGEQATLENSYYIRKLAWDENVWEDMISKMRNEYVHEDENLDQHLNDVSFAISRAEALAQTPIQKTHTTTACSVMCRIFDTDLEYTPGRKASGHWNFFDYYTVENDGGKIRVNSDFNYSFEWKDMSGIGESSDGYGMLFGDIYGILSDNVGCIWADEWCSCDEESSCIEYTMERYKFDMHIKTKIRTQNVGTITTAAGTFDDCLLVEMDIGGELERWWKYRSGRKDFYYAPGVGLVRVVTYFNDGKSKSTYDLTSYIGTGDGYMPIADGMVRRYDAVDMGDGYVGAVEYTYSADENGGIVIFENRTGIRNL